MISLLNLLTTYAKTPLCTVFRAQMFLALKTYFKAAWTDWALRIKTVLLKFYDNTRETGLQVRLFCTKSGVAQTASVRKRGIILTQNSLMVDVSYLTNNFLKLKYSGLTIASRKCKHLQIILRTFFSPVVFVHSMVTRNCLKELLRCTLEHKSSPQKNFIIGDCLLILRSLCRISLQTAKKKETTVDYKSATAVMLAVVKLFYLSFFEIGTAKRAQISM